MCFLNQLTKTINFNTKRLKFANSRLFNSEIQSNRSTIYALSSGQGKCGVAVVRISGPDAILAVEKMTDICNLKPRKAYLRKIRNPHTNDIIDKGICLWFPAPNSFTGENSVEFQIHGGFAVISSLFSALSNLNFRPALAGEFTKRAFFNNKLDLTEIEGLADLIHAETEQQRKQALLQAQGTLSILYKSWRSILLTSLANIEAYIDFGEEENIENDILKKTNLELTELSKKIKNHLCDGRRGEILRTGIRTVILGEPNAGKSSLLNNLVQKNAAIVSSIPGTTRDIIEHTVNINGYPIILADTAGLNKCSKDVIEIEGIKRAKDTAFSSDFIILVINVLKFVDSKKSFQDYFSSYIKELEIENLYVKNKDNFMTIINKIDLVGNEIRDILNKHSNIVCISCTEEYGFEELLNGMAKKCEEICGNPKAENPTISQERHRVHLKNCLDCILSYLNIIKRNNFDFVLAAQEIRKASREIGKITGHISSEEILDTIFGSFCVGK